MSRTLISHIVGFASLLLGIALAGDLNIRLANPVTAGILILAILASLTAGIWDVVQTIRSQPKQFSGSRRNGKILTYMTRLIDNEGRCVMSSNDLSWAQGDAEAALMRKARQGSLTLIMPQKNELSEQLEKAGATAHYYGDRDFRFRSRFTIVNAERSDAWMAIGHGTSDSHMIREIHSQTDPAAYLAEDLFRMAKRHARR